MPCCRRDNNLVNLLTRQPLNLSTSQLLNSSTSQLLNFSTSQPLSLLTYRLSSTPHPCNLFGIDFNVIAKIFSTNSAPDRK